jgi:hypothetical protein
MFGLTSYLRLGRREYISGLMVAVIVGVGLVVCMPSTAHASGCEDSWTNTAGGSWFEGSNWSKGTTPTSEEEACIAAAGTYTVVMTQESGTVSVKSLTVGGASGTQTLAVGSSCSVNAVLTTTKGITNGAQGAITLTNGDGCGDGVTLSGPITNAGTLTVEPEHGGARSLQGNLTNTGTLAINTNTAYNGSSTLLTNNGALNVAEGKTLSIAAKNSVKNGTGGKITTSGSGDVSVEKEAIFTEGVGTTSGTQPVIVDDATLNYTGAGKSLIALRGSSTLSGSLAGSQSLSIQSTCGENAVTTAAASFTNAGSITLTNGDGCGDNATLTVSAGTLTNSGKIVTEVPAGGTRTIQGNLTNTGTLSINASTSYNGTSALLTNEGALNVAEGKTLTVSEKGSVTNGTGGSIVGTGGAYVAVEKEGSFTEGAGTTSGTKPVIIDDGALTYTGSGKSLIALHGESSTLRGSLAGSQSLLIESTCGEHAKTTASESFTNAGTITLTNGDGCGNNATLTVSLGTLTNSGKIVTEVPAGGTRTIQGNLTNTGTLSIKSNTAYNGTGAILTNKGAINIAEGTQLAVTGGGVVTNGSGQIFAPGSASFSQSGGTFNEDAGETIGTEPVILDDLTLNYGGTSTEHGSGRIGLRGTSTLSGTVRSHEILAIESTCSENAVTSAAASFTNSGKIELTNGDGCGNNATLNMKGGTLTNTGTLNAAKPHGGTRAFEGSLTNSGTVVIAAGVTLQVSGNFTQQSTGNFKTRIASASSFGSMSVKGTATIAGTLLMLEVSPFKASAGQQYAILSGSSLTGTFATETGDQVNSTGLYYQPTYSATGVTLVVTQATLVASSTEGAPGSIVTLSGSGYLPGDTITPTFTDHSGVKTTFPSTTTNGSGEFSTEITIPTTAALHGGTIEITSTDTGVHISSPFKVT